MLEFGAKHVLPKPAYTAVLKKLLASCRLATESAFLKTLENGVSAEHLWASRRLTSMKFLVDGSSPSLLEAYKRRFTATLLKSSGRDGPEKRLRAYV